jgi:hypothetical protein
MNGFDRPWQTGAHVGQVVALSARDNARIGHCWMRGRLRDGDLAIVVRHSGDGFWTYRLLEGGAHCTNGHTPGVAAYSVCRGSDFGAYVCGIPTELQPTERQMHLLLAGESVSIGVLAPPAR